VTVPETLAAGPGPGEVTAADSLDDIAWFDANATRRYRVRQGWAIRRRGTVLLRTPIAKPVALVDNEGAADLSWWTAAWPALSAQERKALMVASRPKGRRL
jgi:hypothetical protein